MKKIALCLAAVLLLATVFTGCGGNEESGGKKEVAKNLSVCTGPEPTTIDPALNKTADGGTLCLHAFEGLMRLDKDGMPIYGQAESHSVSDDQLTYTFTLRPDLKWSDGKALTAKDFVYSWRRAVNPATGADYSYMFEVVSGYEEAIDSAGKGKSPDLTKLAVSAPDERTVVVTLKAITPYFLELCAFPVFYPVREDVVTANPEQWTQSPTTYLSNGPYRLVAWEHKSVIKMEKNPNYWDKENIGPDTIDFKLMEDHGAILSAYQNGSISFADEIPVDEIAVWKTKPDYHIKDQIGTYYLSFNTKKAPLDNKLVRQALILAVNRPYLCEQVGQTDQIPAGAFVSSGLSDVDPGSDFRAKGGEYYDPDDYEGNLEKARELLKEAGYEGGKGLPAIEYLYNEGTTHQQIGEALQRDWAKLGVTVTLQSQEWNTFVNTRKNGDYDIARNGWLSDYNDPIAFLDMWITDGGNNDAHWSNPAYDELIAKIKTTADKAERFAMMHQAEDLIFDDSMLCPIWFYSDYYLIKSNVSGFFASALGYKYFMYTTTYAS